MEICFEGEDLGSEVKRREWLNTHCVLTLLTDRWFVHDLQNRVELSPFWHQGLSAHHIPRQWPAMLYFWYLTRQALGMRQSSVKSARTAINFPVGWGISLPPKIIMTRHVLLVETILLCDREIPLFHKIAISVESRKQRKNRLTSLVHEPKPTIRKMSACRVQSRFKLVYYRPHLF